MYFSALPKRGLARVPENDLCPESRSWTTVDEGAPSKTATGILLDISCAPRGDRFKT